MRLAPAAEVAVDALALTSGERVVDVGCGTGNAALLAARAGGSVLGVDPSARLLAAARAAAADAGLTCEFETGEGAAIPAGDGAFDAAVSVFGVIFADAEAAAAELLRVVRPGGRIVLTTWTPAGPTPKVTAAMLDALGVPPTPPRWSDPDVLRSLFAPHPVTIAEHPLAFTAASAAEYVAEHTDHHPMWLAAAPALAEHGKLEEVQETARAIFEEANEDPAAFRTTSHYHLVTVEPGGA